MGTVGCEIEAAEQFGLSGALSMFGTTPPVRDVTTPRSGAAAWKCDSAAGNTTSFITANFSAAVNTSFFLRVYMNFSQLPGGTIKVVSYESTAISARLTSAGKLQLWNDSAGTQIGSDSAATVATGSYYRIELKIQTAAGTTQIAACELQLDGVSVASTTGLAISAPTSINIGWQAAPGASKVCFVDDVALNDSTGAAQTSWPGDGKIVLCVPVSDNARTTGWVTGAGGTTSLWDAVNNTPPVGVADTGTATSQIRDATSEASASYDANLTTYTAAGVGASDTVNVVIPMVATGAPVTTGSKQGLIGMASNPAITTVALSATGTAGAFWAGAGAGTYPTGWKWSFGTTTYAPSVTLGTSPVARITQVTASTRIADVCALMMYVDYTAAAITAAAIPDVGMGLTVT